MAPPAGLSSVFGSYHKPSGHYDELLDAKGDVRANWKIAAAEVEALGVEGFRQRADQVRRIVQENGVTYSGYSDDGAARPWVMDPLPMILSYQEWRELDHGLRQRVTLLNRILEDVYGEQHLLKDRVLPPSLILGNPHFLRPLHGFRPPGGTFVHLYAADLARSPDGRWWVLSDRLDTPSGIGYALENRFVTQRALSDIFRAVDPLRLRPFFQSMLESFELLVQRRTEHPMIVLLSPGPGHEAYFEHAFFARNLGYPLVEGADLTTRDQKVFLKTVGGLKQVDVIIRSVQSPLADPLELDSESLLGVPGLVQAARAGNVAIANSLGSGIAESPALAAFLPQLCTHLLGESLSLPSARTWWCGDEPSLAYVMEHLDQLVIKPVIRRKVGEAQYGGNLDVVALDKLRRQILAKPGDFCAQEMVARATVPALNPLGETVPRHFLMRVFLVATEHGYEMMPGGLSRLTGVSDHHSLAIAEGGTSKDTWVLSHPELPTRDHPLPHTGPVRIRRSTAELTSRDADNLFWLGRYLERGDFLARLLRLIFNELRESTGQTANTALLPFVRTVLSDELDEPEIDWLELERRVTDLVWSQQAPGNLSSCLLSLGRASFAIRERLSLDATALISQLERFAAPRRSSSASSRLDPAERLNDILMVLAGLAGTISENMTRALDWHFLEMGRRLERSQNVIELLQQVFSKPGPYSEPLLANLLVAADSRYTYASRYLTNLQPEAVVDLILLDPSNPRSVAFQAQAVTQHLEHLPVLETEEPQTERRRLARRVAAELDLANVRELLQPARLTGIPRLHRMLRTLSEQLLDLADGLAQHYFAHADGNDLSSRLD